MNRYYAAHDDAVVIFPNREARDAFCHCNVFQPIDFYTFASRDLGAGWGLVTDHTSDKGEKWTYLDF